MARGCRVPPNRYLFGRRCNRAIFLNKVPQSSSSNTPVVCIVGPTGSGKSRLAFDLARALNGEVVNCDSLQVYCGFDIGTAKPSRQEQATVPHHLIDIVSPLDEFSAGEYARRARQVIPAITDRGTLPVVAGGTGFYLKALIDGLVEGPQRDGEIRERLLQVEQRRPGRLHRLLRRCDPASAMRIHASDVQKLVRALELILLEREPLSRVYERPRLAADEFQTVQLGLDPPRQALYARLDARSRAMWHGGLIEETRDLLAKGVPLSAKPFGAIGYKQALAVIEGKMEPAEALAEMQRDTRRYAKRQWTWFRRDPRVLWIKDFGDSSGAFRTAVRYIYKRSLVF
ncbi:MAG: tRNA (adenosine(37)-N6)-dimethylallyltransferase MiaA [Bryobacterales bacterium]|nr:tRNA (adenosine(37)-N6)-dimethylallyltransferase MiaA [Bryobacterales bacterium]